MSRFAVSPRFVRATVLSLVTAASVAFVSRANAGPSQVYGSEFAWVNNFNNSTINSSFGTGSTPNMTFWYNFPSGNLYGYPACIRGWHYGWNPANDNLFPMQLSAASSIPCSFSYSSGGTSMSGDFAYDMFLRWDNAKSTPQLEVMVWAGNNSWPIGTQTGTNVVSAGGYTFDLWEGMNTAAGYYVYTFIPHGTAGVGSLPTSGSLNVDMKTFYNWLQANRSGSGRFSNSMYLDVVEAGLEITGGNGWAWIGANFNATTGSSGGGGGGGGGAIANGTYRIVARNSGQALDVYQKQTANNTNVDQWPYNGGTNQQWQVTNLGNGAYKIIGVQSGRSLDAYGYGASGANVDIWDYSGGTNQQWILTPTSGGYYRISPSYNQGLALDVVGASSSNGANIDVYTWNGGNNQQWSFQAP